MKFVLDIGGNKYALSFAAVEKITEALAGAEWIEHKYVSKDISPTNYVDLLSPVVVHERIAVSPMDDDYYGALQLTTKLFREKNGS